MIPQIKSGDSIKIIVRPNSSKTEIIKWEKDSIRLAVKAPPIKGKANQEVIRFMKKYLKCDVKIVSGSTGRVKILRVC